MLTAAGRWLLHRDSCAPSGFPKASPAWSWSELSGLLAVFGDRFAAELVVGGVRAAGARLGRGCTAEEEVVQEKDRIGQLDQAVVVAVARIQAGWFSAAKKEVVESEDGIGQVHDAVGIGISTQELRASRRRRLLAVEGIRAIGIGTISVAISIIIETIVTDLSIGAARVDRLAIQLREDHTAVEDLHDALVDLGARIHMFQPEAMDMEAAFMKLTEGKTA